MILVESILGNASEPDWAARIASSTVDMLQLDHWEAQKTRFKKRTRDGAEIAVSLDRGTFIRDGDVLLWDAQTPALVVASIRLRDVMMIDLDKLAEATRSATSTGRRWSREPGYMCL